VGNGISEQTTLPDFLRTYCGTTRVQLLDADPGEFAAELEKRWRERTPALERPSAAGTNGGRGDIFISYAREDVEAARRLHASLTAIGGDVWLDERRLLPGDPWQDEILAGIRRGIRLFVPLVSRHTESRSEGYVFREWREAVERSKSVMNRRFIVPVAVDPDYDGNPDRLEQLPEEFRQLDFGRAPGGVPSEALLAAFTQDIRALRRPAAA